MTVKDVIGILLDFPMDAPCFVISKEKDLEDVVGDPFPDLKFGTVVVSSEGENGEKENTDAVVIVGNFKSYEEKKEEEVK